MNPEQFVFCPRCQGRGQLERQICRECVGQGKPAVSLRLEDKWLFFDFSQLRAANIFQRRMTVKLDFIIDLFLYLVATVGFLCLAYYLYQQFSSREVELPLGLLKSDFWQLSSVYLRVFFGILMIDYFLIYRLAYREEQEQVVMHKEYQRFPVPTPATMPGRWVNVTDTFDEQARAMIEDAYLFCVNNRYRVLHPLHLLATMLPMAASRLIMWRLSLDPGILIAKIKRGLEGVLFTGSQDQGIDPAFQQVILQAYAEVYERGGDRKVKIADLWIPLAEVPSYAREILYDLDIEADKMRHLVRWLQVEEDIRQRQVMRRGRTHGRSKYGINRTMTAVQTKTLNAYSQDLTMYAKSGALPPSLGHEQELEQIFTILQGGAKGVVLVGRPGVGKSSLVEEVAEQMAAELVPEVLRDKRLLSLSVAGIMAGGDPAKAGERLFQALYEAAHSGNVILFIKDIHNLVGVGLQTPGRAETMGIDQILIQAMEGNRFLVIGTTDYKNFGRFVENSSIGQTFVKIDVPEPDQSETILMLEARVPYIEAKSRVFFSYQALERTVELTEKLVHSGHQPEKSLNILQELAAKIAAERGHNTVITDADVASIISQKIGMPVTKIKEDEGEQLMNLETVIHEKYIDQDYAVGQVAAALRRARAELRDEKRPIANFLFIGPTGVGKTELAKRIAEIYFNSEQNMIRLDMSEFQEINSISRLIGTASEPGLLTEPVRTRPYSILLLDELEKAHKNILNLFLQVMDDGRATSADGEVIDFTNVILVATSNAGTPKLQALLAEGKTVEQIHDEFVKVHLLEYFRPEFLNRFDDIIIFKPLAITDIERIAELILNDIAIKLERKGITLKVTPEALQELARLGFDPLYGARPLRRATQDHVQNALANYLISGAIGRRDTVYLEPGGQIRIEKASAL